MNKNIIIEIGGYDGSDTQRYADMPNTFVYCFEPNKDFFTQLKNRFEKYKNVKIPRASVVFKFWFGDIEPGKIPITLVRRMKQKTKMI